MDILSEKILYEKEVTEQLIDADAEIILWGEDLFDAKIILYPKKISAIPGYDKVKKELVNAALIYFDFTKEQFIKTSIIRFNPNTHIAYIVRSSFNGIWKYLRNSVDLGIRIQKENDKEVSFDCPEDIVDLSLLQKSGSKAIIKDGEIVYIRKEVSQEDRNAQSKKQSLLDDKRNRFFYDARENIYHDKECEYIKEIAPEYFMAAKAVPEEFNPCRKCRRRMCLRKACEPNVKEIPLVNQLLTKAEIKDVYLEKLVFQYGLKFHVNTTGELTVIGKEDTWIIKGFDKDCLSLWHNNYVKTSSTERYITDGFHNQGMDGKSLYWMLECINSYTYDKHLESEDVNVEGISSKIGIEESATQEEQGLLIRFKRFIKALFNRSV